MMYADEATGRPQVRMERKGADHNSSAVSRTEERDLFLEMD